MTIAYEVVIRSPISVGNVGGFDVGGMTLQKPENLYVFQQLKADSRSPWRRRLSVSYGGKYGSALARLAEDNPDEEFVTQNVQKFLAKYARGQPFDYKISVTQEIPVKRGSGASAAARGTSWYGMNVLTATGLSLYDIVRDVAEQETHWDNIAPNMLGGYVYILPEGDSDATLIRHDSIPHHGELLVIPPFEKKSTVVLRPPVQRFRADKRVLTDAVYRAGMVFRSTGSLAVAESQVLYLAHELTKDAPEEVPMPYVVSKMQEMIRAMNTYFSRKGKTSSSQRIVEFGEYSINDETHVKARAEIRGYGPFDYSDWRTQTEKIRNLGGWLRISGAGPNHVIAFNINNTPDEALNRMIKEEKVFWGDIGYDPADLEFRTTRPAASGTEILYITSRNGHRQNEITITRQTLEALLFSAQR